MNKDLTYNQLVKKLSETDGQIFMMIGNGTKNQFRYINDLKNVIKSILKKIPENSSVLYFGDSPNSKKPDIGYAFKLISLYRPDIKVYMIQISEAKSWGYPDFVDGVYWHNDFTKKCKWGGLNNSGEPCSNTKKWVKLAQRVKINGIYVLGGGEITLQEVKLAKKLRIKIHYFPIERRFKGDGKTRVKQTDKKSERVGITYSLRK